MNITAGDETPEQMAAKILAEMNKPEPLIKLPSQFQIGDAAFLRLWEDDLIVEINAVHFYAGKVKYDVNVLVSDGTKTRMYNIDSAFFAARIQK